MIMPITIKEQTFNTSKVSLNYVEVSTTGAPLVLLHGGSSQWRNFEILLPDLTASWYLYALDFRGHGNSERAESYRLQDFVDDVIAFLCEVIGEPVAFVGHSLGGWLGLLLQADPNAGGIMTDAEVAQAMTLLPNPSHVFLPGISHVLHNEQKAPVLEAIIAFLDD